jgi:hypothetical protein
MKLTQSVFVALTVGLLTVAGCGKSEPPKPATPPPGTVDLSSLQQAFSAPTPEASTSLDKLRFSIRYRTFNTALPELEKLSRLPNLTDEQKKAISEVTEQVKTAMQNPPPAPSQ